MKGMFELRKEIFTFDCKMTSDSALNSQSFDIWPHHGNHDMDPNTPLQRHLVFNSFQLSSTTVHQLELRMMFVHTLVRIHRIPKELKL
ncbi:unnamed protein product, partial [Leptidea sinapis]